MMGWSDFIRSKTRVLQPPGVDPALPAAARAAATPLPASLCPSALILAEGAAAPGSQQRVGGDTAPRAP